MKFGKKLRELVQESDEEWKPNFMDYKELKKCIQPAPSPHNLGCDDGATNHRQCMSTKSKDSDDDEEDENDNDMDNENELPETVLVNNNPNKHKEMLSINKQAVRKAEQQHAEFFYRFKREVDKVNEFFLEKQEDFIIEHQHLLSRVNQSVAPGSATRKLINDLRERLIKYHGELIVLEQFSTVNYTGFRKILKKHDKKTGINIQSVYLNTVLVTPFFLSDTVRRLIQSTESQLAKLDNVVKFKKPNPISSFNNSPAGSTPSSDQASVQSQKQTHLQKQLQQQQQLLRQQVSSQQKKRPLRGVSVDRESSPQSAVPTPVPIAYDRNSTSPPKPHAFIPPHSALWRLYRTTRDFASSCEAPATTGAASPSSTTSSSDSTKVMNTVLRLADEIRCEELGINDQFLNKVITPSLYIIVNGSNLSIGFIVLPPNTTLQAFPDKVRKLLITKNLSGVASLRIFKRTAADTTGTNNDLTLQYVRGAVTTGPWPSVIADCDQPIEWGAGHASRVALFFIAVPPVHGNDFPAFCISSDKQSLKVFSKGFKGFKAQRDPNKDVDWVEVECE